MIRKLCLAVLATLLALAQAAPALAWGTTGHRLITRIALANTTPATRAAIAELLRHEAELGTPQCRIDDLEDASSWPDCVRLERWRFAYTEPWHEQNVAVCAAIFDPKGTCADGNCVTAQIDRDRRILADKSLPPAIRMEALAFLVHFVGDVHMPLHAADLHHDLGGANVTISNFPPGDYVQPAKPAPIVMRRELKPITLHWLWDDALVKAMIRQDGRDSLVHAYAPAERAAIATGEPLGWARESWQIARDLVYPQAYGHDPCVGDAPASVAISDAAVARDIPVVRQRLTQAGLRLARVLDEALGS